MTGRRVEAVLAAGEWPAEEEVATVTLNHDDRHRRRLTLADDRGQAFLLDLPRAQRLDDGDGLKLVGGGVIRVRAATELVCEARARDPAHLARLAWHLGNRHAGVEILDERTLRVRDDPVLGAMLEGLGGVVVRLMAPFSPEIGAYHLPHPHDPDR